MAEESRSDEELEKLNFLRVYLTFKSYRQKGQEIFSKKEQFIESLPENNQKLLETFRDHLMRLKCCVLKNDELIDLIVKDVHSMFDNDLGCAQLLSEDSVNTKPYSFDKLKFVFKQIVREWTAEGRTERDSSYAPIIADIVENFPPNKSNPKNVKVLVPGAALGRLPFEIVSRGYSCQGNDFSLFMLFVSNFILNRSEGGIDRFSFHPYIHQLDNLLSNSDQLACISFPDVDPKSLNLDNSLLSMTAGEFVQVYKNQHEQWDCVATCFFIDCHPNIVAVIETIYNILKPGGVWINNGPLLYHYSDSEKENSIELSYEEVKKVILAIGFRYKKDSAIKATYTANPRCMFQFYYTNLYFVCLKPNS